MSSPETALATLEPPRQNGSYNGSSKARLKVLRPVAKRKRPRLRDDLQVLFPGPGRLEFRSESRFSTWNNNRCRQFIELSLGIHEVREVEIDSFNRTAAVVYRHGGNSSQVVRKIARIYRGDLAPDSRPTLSPELLRALPKSQPTLRAFRYGEVISTWELRMQLPGWIRLRNALVLNKPHLARYLEKELVSLMGIKHHEIHVRGGSITIEFNPQIIHKQQIVSHLDAALCRAPKRPLKQVGDHHFKIASASLALSATATFFNPALLPIGAVLMLYTAIPSFRRAYHSMRHERRLGIDSLDTIIFTACLFTGEIFAGAMTAWFLSLGRKLLKQTRAESAKVLLQMFGKQPTLARVLKDGREIETDLEKIKRDNRIVIYTGEVVPVDGVIVEGDAILDQHALTGESAPAEKSVGGKVFASTVMLAGKIVVRVERAGKDTASSKISRILNKTVAHKLRAQSRGEELADKAVLPALGLSALAGGTVGASGALAVINSDLGTGIRMAAPLGMLTSITLCAQQGILVKDGRALELMRNVDTVLFDKTGTLTREKPEVGKILCCGDYPEEQILTFAAGAEQKFTHPIARAILDKFAALKRPMPRLDASKYHVGYGITVEIEGYTVRVGSRRFIEMENLAIPDRVELEMKELHATGHSFVCVAIGNQLAGVIELQSSHRPEVEEIISGLRTRGVNHMAIISGDHEKPTRRLAEHLKMDRYFAEVLPQDKARYVELLQKEGRTVCFVGDGINDSIALKKANVSISLRGASSIATDTAQIVFMEESLARICDLKDFSLALEHNVQRSWNLILMPNGFCIAGVFLFGFNIWHSVFFNNASAILALLNGLLPLRKAARLHEERQKSRQLLVEI
ncbi:MAG: heavy metal translocating P-type ATPase [Methylacidiphilales bacterium]|nr:heavy metal translocating P-type ATPase [Candidatus Methylacidiphilales bacterium]